MADPRIDELKRLLPAGMLPDWVRLGSRLVRLLRDRLHADKHDALLDRLLREAQASVALRKKRLDLVPQATYPQDLPITQRKSDIINAIRTHQVVIIAGETGSGKTTQIPKMCLEAGLGIEAKIGCTQPRRVAALSISRRIAEELNVAWGQEVGCKIRFEDHSNPETYVKLMTDGILLAETQADPLLAEYNALIIDEAHERSLNIDFLLGYLKSLLAKRKDLKLIVTSATIDTDAFSKAFDNAPVIEVSGRVYPVEVVYAPLDSASEEEGEITYIDAAVRAAEQVLCEPGSGDILIFMPTERDIRETADQIEGRFGSFAEVVPLYGRLSSGDQQRVFVPCERRKIVIATNIAETSLTIPGIRYVIDSGLARMSRYNPRTRTKRLPVESVSQSSANQRKGRAGRLSSGVCIRLYSAEDFAARPEFTQPEIQRANLAEVILRMKAFSLGEIETFAFVNPPTQAAIQNGYALLQELGALDDTRTLTPLGRDIARLPIDPTLGRMLIQSQSEHATRELLIIASGLSIQDPRERPLDQKEAAAAAHKRFLDPRSDFLTLLNIWNAVHDKWENLRSQGQRRKFCKTQFLSYVRMREWQELHAMLQDVLDGMGTLKLNESNATDNAVHRSILPGLLGQIATRTDRNVYKAAGNRQVTLFPGSVLYDRSEPQKRRPTNQQPASKGKPQTSHQPLWIMAGEVLETSQLFARTTAGIDPLWILQLAPHLCKFTHQNPHWSPQSGRVLVTEKATLHGLEIHNRKVDYENIDTPEAARIFIQSALIEEGLFPEPGAPQGRAASFLGIGHAPQRDDHKTPSENPNFSLTEAQASSPENTSLPPRFAFLEHNRRIRQKVETWQTRVRRNDLPSIDQALFLFYSKRLGNVASIHKLNRVLGEHPDPSFLRLTEADLTGGLELTFNADDFPDALSLDGQPVPLSYAYAPGEETDGVTIKLAFDLAQSLSPASVEWAVPGLRCEQIAELLRALPKSIRRELMPFPPKILEITRDLRPAGHSLLHDLAAFIRQRYHIEVSASSWPSNAVPPHLMPRLEILGNDLKTVAVGRDLLQLRKKLESITLPPVKPQEEHPGWSKARQRWERFDLREWCVGDLPESILIHETGGLPVYAWPALLVEDGTVNLRLLKSSEASKTGSLQGVRRLVELGLEKDLAWAAKDLRGLARYDTLTVTLCSPEELQVDALEHLKTHLFPQEPLAALKESLFATAVVNTRNRLKGIVPPLVNRIGEILQLRQTILLRFPAPRPLSPAKHTMLSDLSRLVQPAPKAAVQTLASDLETLLPKNFLKVIPLEQLQQVPRYLKAILIRAERAALNPAKDQERTRILSPYVEALKKLPASSQPSCERAKRIEEFRWMIEEFKVSLFAQELGTACPVSTKRLDQQWEKVRDSY